LEIYVLDCSILAFASEFFCTDYFCSHQIQIELFRYFFRRFIQWRSKEK